MPDDKPRGISVNFVIRNGVRQGYPFWESLKSCLPFADEIVISEGNSTDDTGMYIERFAAKFGGSVPISVHHDDWTSVSSPHGEVISVISGKNHRRCRREWVYYLQADEVLHDENSQFVRDIAINHRREFNSVSFRFCHFIGNWNPMEKGIAYDEAIRMVKNMCGIGFVGDAWNFKGKVAPICPAGLSPRPIYHLGWVFPKNCDAKAVEHGAMYTGLGEYQRAAAEARKRMSGNVRRDIPPPSGFNDFPPSVMRLIGLQEYVLPEEATT